MSALLAALRDAVGSVVTDPGAMEGYRWDQSGLGDAGVPAAVVLACSEADVISVIRIAGEHGVPVVSRGAGTGLAGGAHALPGSIVLSLQRMDAILALDPASRTARVQPGVLNGALDRTAAEHGLWYAPDPGSREICTIGGNIATNAGGMCCAKYGVTADHVRALRMVTGTGEVVELGGSTRKNVVGLDLVRLVVGSEGTLGVVTEATVALNRRPREIATAVATFGTVRSAIDAVVAQPGDAMAIEIMDSSTVRAVEEMTRMGLDTDAGAILLAQFDGRDSAGAAEEFAATAEGLGAEVFHTGDLEEGAAFMAARRAAYPALERLGATLLDDVGVTVDRLPALFAAVERVAADHGVRIGTFGHAADGNLHPTIIYRRGDEADERRALRAFEALLEEALALGGTISGEHGVGSLKQPYARRQLDPLALRLMTGVKAVFDPGSILNPGRGF